MQTAQQKIHTHEQFQNAEQLWFWFLYCKSIRTMVSFQSNIPKRRVCELLDVETLITKLYLCGKLNDEHLQILKEFGDKRRAPHQYIWSENHAAAIWNDAIHVIDIAARARGWIE